MAFLKKRNQTATVAPTTTGRKMGMTKLASGIPLILLALAAWVVELAGVAVVRKQAGEDGFGGMALDFTWFVIFGTLFVLLFALISLIGDGFAVLPSGHAAITGLLAIMTTLSILETRTWDDLRKVGGPPYYKTTVTKGAVTAYAGFLSTSALMGILIIVLGSQTNARAHSHHHDEYVAPAGTVPAHNTGVQSVV